MDMIQNVESWLFKVAAKKVIIKVATMVVAWLASGVIQGYLTQAGVHYDQNQLQAALTGLMLAGLKAIEDWVNLKYGTNI